MEEYLNFQKEVITRRTSYDLEKAKDLSGNVYLYDIDFPASHWVKENEEGPECFYDGQ